MRPGADLTALTAEWLRGVTGAVFVPGVRARARAALRELLEELVAAVRAEPFDPAAGDRIGTELVDLRMSAPPVIGMTVRLLAARLPPLIEGDPAVVRARILDLLEHVTTGFVAAQRDAAVRAAEQMNRSEKIHWRRVQTDLQRRLQHDPVTGLPNEQQLRQHLAAGDGMGLCLLGIDRFPELADTLGHDTLLTAVAAMLRQITGVFLAHLGNDQFALVADANDLLKAADEARRVLLPLRVDVRAALVEGAGRTPDDWLRDARLALGWARQDRRDHAVFEPGRAEIDRRRHRLAADLPSALDNGEIVAHYQPLYRLADRAVIGAEALARWQRPAGGPLLGPPDFITLAERTGLIRPLGRQVLEQACRQGARWRRAGHDLLISVNLSPLQLSEPTLPADVADILHRAGLPAGNLQLEITESAALDHGSVTLRQVADLGVRLALDDFGTGYSSLATLSRLPVSTVKLAAEFLAEPRVLQHAIALGHALDLTVTAEGIETAAQESLLRSLGCDIGQGFHFGRPSGNPDTVVGRC
ncbi:putative bifunctional diguanylate cyclase/phosphodiesterase [Actinoplanes sp. NPDC051513]|uniref:putative bifunctional diguanylate cyclase/phosphodiesterase n=1 Tax=Actinoplanes sp. NPDC051513 TaxID=3363908 RepID=UPI0037A087E7